MRRWDAQQIARLAGARLLVAPPPGDSGPERATADSRDAGPGALFVGLPGEHVHGGSYAPAALVAGAWGVLTTPEHTRAALAGIAGEQPGRGPAILSTTDPLDALQRLATAWRRELGARVIGITGSTGKTSTKDLLLAVLSPHRRTVASRANLNTEIGLPLELLAAPAGTEVLVLEMAMRGPGQIAELARVAEPDVGVIVSIGPAHLEQLGTIEAIAAAKAELLRGLPAGGVAVLPADERLLDPHRRADLTTLTFGPGGDVTMLGESEDRVEIDCAGERLSLVVDFRQAHLRHDLLAAVAAAKAVGVTPGGRLDPRLTPGRGQLTALPGGITLIDDSYNANPVSMRASLDELAVIAERSGLERHGGRAPGRGGGELAGPRRVAVLGDMLELGAAGPAYHAEIAAHAATIVDVLVTVGPLAGSMADRFPGEHHHADDARAAAELTSGLLRDGDVVLVKGSLGVGLKHVCEALRAGAPA
jgi:UDP-N-acetylmuramoyl-tripeptide--D-alanyl-D-alanine ligase